MLGRFIPNESLTNPPADTPSLQSDPNPKPESEMSNPTSGMARRYALRALATLITTSAVQLAFAQDSAQATAPAKPAVQTDQELVELPVFNITEKPVNPYQSGQALSSSRIAVNVSDVPQTLSVVTNELIADSLGARMLDVAKYVTPVVESTLPFGGDRYMIRGFQVSQEFIDGTVISGADGYSMSIAPYNIERVEVIKGPNAILVPGGSPGGVMNPITKAPVGKDHTRVTLELAEYNGNAVSIDVNRVIDAKSGMAVRLVAAGWKNDLYIKNQFRNGYMVAPSFSMRLSPMHKLTVKAELVQNRETNLGGVPIDPSVGSGQYAKVARGLPRNWSFGDRADARHRTTDRISAELESTLSDHVTSRLYVMADEVRRIDVGGTNAGLTSAGGGSRNPLTGNYEPGVTWTTTTNADGTVNAVSSSAPVTDPSTWIYTRNLGKVDLKYTEAHLKNDYAARYDLGWGKSTTIGGLAANTSKVHFISYPSFNRGSIAATNLSAITYPDYKFVGIQPGLTTASLGTNKTAKQNDLQLYLYETLNFLNDHVIVSGGVSRFYGELSRTDTTGTAIDPTLLLTAPSYNLTDTAHSYGIVVKPIKPISLFYAHNTTGGTMPGSLSAGTDAPSLRLAEGAQNEFGVKGNALKGALTGSFAYFDIKQKNYSVPNSEWYRLTAEGKTAEAAALQNPLYLDLNSKGWEFEGTYSFNANLTILANYTKFKMRQPITEVRVRAVPDQAGGIYADYRWHDGVLKGFGVNLGVDWKGDVAGENTTGYTTSKPLASGTAKFVPSQPSFLVAGRTLANLGVSYRAKDWTVRLMVTNVTNKDYILAAGSRASLVVGEPRAWKLSTTYSF